MNVDLTCPHCIEEDVWQDAVLYCLENSIELDRGLLYAKSKQLRNNHAKRVKIAEKHSESYKVFRLNNLEENPIHESKVNLIKSLRAEGYSNVEIARKIRRNFEFYCNKVGA